MISLALKMLIGNKSACLGVIFGIFLATLLIAQQSAIFLGLTARSYRMVTDISAPNIWIMDPATESEERFRALPEQYVEIVRSIPNVEWAVPLRTINIPLITGEGKFEVCKLYGVDEASLIGAPTQMIEGNIRDLYREGSVIVDIHSANGTLATTLSDGTHVPLKVGDELEINNHRAIVVGLCRITQGFYPQPILFTSASSFKTFTPATNRLGFILAKTYPGADVKEVLKKINSHAGLQALTRDQFKSRIVQSFLKTGILINFGLSVALGVIIGFSIAGQIFYSMTLANLMYYALIKAVGGTQKMILQMIAVQALVVGVLGFCLGMGATVLWGLATKGTTLAFLLPWQLLVFTGAIIFIICLSAAILSIRKVFSVDPKVLMGT
jgi:putative ABC transport system permease protein